MKLDWNEKIKLRNGKIYQAYQWHILNIRTLFVLCIFDIYHHLIAYIFSQLNVAIWRRRERVSVLFLYHHYLSFTLVYDPSSFSFKRQMSVVLLHNSNCTCRVVFIFIEQGPPVYMSITRRFLSFQNINYFFFIYTVLMNQIESTTFSLSFSLRFFLWHRRNFTFTMVSRSFFFLSSTSHLLPPIDYRMYRQQIRFHIRTNLYVYVLLHSSVFIFQYTSLWY
jgi:hypothetical protein